MSSLRARRAANAERAHHGVRRKDIVLTEMMLDKLLRELMTIARMEQTSSNVTGVIRDPELDLVTAVRICAGMQTKRALIEAILKIHPVGTASGSENFV